MPPKTDLEKAEEALLKCRKETYGTPFLVETPQPPVHPFAGYSIRSFNASAQKAAAKTIAQKRGARKKPQTAPSRRFSFAPSATPKTRSLLFGAASSSP